MESPAATVAFVTYTAAPTLTADDALAVAPLAERGVTVVPAIWTDDTIDWSAFDAIVLRSPWEYYREPERFFAWLDRVEATGVPVWNSPATVRWNARKTYLMELAARGVRTIPSELVARGTAATLAGIQRRTGWGELVVKPVISGGAYETWRAGSEPTPDEERQFADFVAARDAIVQPFLPEIADGEWSFIFLHGTLSHAVRKRPREGDFRVQPQHGGITRLEQPAERLVAQAAFVLTQMPDPRDPPLYARVDACEVDGRLLLMELEVIEPNLFLGCDAGAPARFADAIVRALANAAEGAAER